MNKKDWKGVAMMVPAVFLLIVGFAAFGSGIGLIPILLGAGLMYGAFRALSEDPAAENG